MTYHDWEDKLAAILSYLQTLFPGFFIEKIKDPLRCQLFRKHIFRIEDLSRGIENLFSLDYDYLHRYTPEKVMELFEKRNLKKILEAPGSNEVLMTDDGIRVLPREKKV
jgi:hypothetical protein